MNEEVYAAALKSALTQIESTYPEMSESYILLNDDTLISGDKQTDQTAMKKVVSSLKDLNANIGGLDDLSIEGENGKVYISRIRNMYFISKASKKADLSRLGTITGVVLPTILNILDSISFDTTTLPTPLEPVPNLSSTPLSTLSEPEHLENDAEENATKEIDELAENMGENAVSKFPEALETETVEKKLEHEDSDQQITDLPSQQFIVDEFGGFMVRSDTVQIDSDVLQRWSEKLNVKEIPEVDIETFDEKTTRCKTKEITDKKLQGRGLIRIPEKLCGSLELKKGELVRAKPVVI